MTCKDKLLIMAPVTCINKCHTCCSSSVNLATRQWFSMAVGYRWLFNIDESGSTQTGWKADTVFRQLNWNSKRGAHSVERRNWTLRIRLTHCHNPSVWFIFRIAHLRDNAQMWHHSLGNNQYFFSMNGGLGSQAESGVYLKRFVATKKDAAWAKFMKTT